MTALLRLPFVSEGIAAALTLALLTAAYFGINARHWRKVADTAQRTATTLELRNRVTIASLDQCTGFLTEQNAAAEARAAELHAAQVANARDVATADARRDADRGRIASLEALVRAPERAGCRADDALLRGLEGL